MNRQNLSKDEERRLLEAFHEFCYGTGQAKIHGKATKYDPKEVSNPAENISRSDIVVDPLKKDMKMLNELLAEDGDVSCMWVGFYRYNGKTFFHGGFVCHIYCGGVWGALYDRVNPDGSLHLLPCAGRWSTKCGSTTYSVNCAD